MHRAHPSLIIIIIIFIYIAIIKCPVITRACSKIGSEGLVLQRKKRHSCGE